MLMVSFCDHTFTVSHLSFCFVNIYYVNYLEAIFFAQIFMKLYQIIRPNDR